jgi:hypothetical protein
VPQAKAAAKKTAMNRFMRASADKVCRMAAAAKWDLGPRRLS